MSTQNPRVCVSKCDPCGSEKVTNPHGSSPLPGALPLPRDPAPAPAPAAAAATTPFAVTPIGVSQTGRAFLANRTAARWTCARGGVRAATRATGAICTGGGSARTGAGVTVRCGASSALGDGVGRSAIRTRRALDTISRAGASGRLGAIAPAKISCSAMETANARVNRRPAAVPKKTPSRS